MYFQITPLVVHRPSAAALVAEIAKPQLGYKSPARALAQFPINLSTGSKNGGRRTVRRRTRGARCEPPGGHRGMTATPERPGSLQGLLDWSLETAPTSPPPPRSWPLATRRLHLRPAGEECQQL